MKLNLIYKSNKDLLSKVLLVLILLTSLNLSISIALESTKLKIKARLKAEFKNQLSHKKSKSLGKSKLHSQNLKLRNKLSLNKSEKVLLNSKASETEKKDKIAMSNNKTVVNNNLLNNKNLSAETMSNKQINNYNNIKNNENLTHSFNSNEVSRNLRPQYTNNIEHFRNNNYDGESKYYNSNGSTHFAWQSSDSNSNQESRSSNSNDSVAISSNFNSVSKLASSISSATYNNPVLSTNIKKPQYVEKIGYYDRDPPTQKSTEAVSLSNPSLEAFYQPFSK